VEISIYGLVRGAGSHPLLLYRENILVLGKTNDHAKIDKVRILGCRVEKTASGGWSGVVCRDQKWKWKMLSPEAGHRITSFRKSIMQEF